MKKIKWILVALVLFTAVSVACQLPTDNLPQPELPEFSPPEKGLNRTTPLPVGETIEQKNWTVEVLQFSRGQEAWETLKALPYSNNEPPGIGEEYALVQMHVTHTNKRAEEESVGISLTGSAGLEYFSFDSGLSIPSPYLVTHLEGGASHEGWYSYVIAEDETDLMLVVDDYSSDARTYAALEEGASLLRPSELIAIEPTNRGKDIREPAPFGVTVTNEDWELTITDVIIGDEAWEILHEANQFNDPPGADTDYILVKISVRYIGQEREPFNMYSYHLKLLNGTGEEYADPVLVEPRPDFDFKMYPGAVAEGWLGYAAFKEDSGLMLRFNHTYDADSPEIRYLSLNASGR